MSTCCSPTRPTGCSRTPACSRCSSTRRATSASSSGPRVARRAGARPLRGRRPRLGRRRARRLARARRGHGAPARGRGHRPRGRRSRDACSPTPRSPCSARSASPPSRCSSSRSRRRSSRRPRGAGIVVVGLTDRWRHEGLGRPATALATRADGQTILVRGASGPAGSRHEQPDALHLDDRRANRYRAHGGGFPFTQGWLPGPGGGAAERSPPKVCSTPRARPSGRGTSLPSCQRMRTSGTSAIAWRWESSRTSPRGRSIRSRASVSRSRRRPSERSPCVWSTAARRARWRRRTRSRTTRRRGPAGSP